MTRSNPMKNVFLTGLIFSMLLYCSVISAESSKVNSEPIKVVIDTDAFPLEGFENDGQASGIVIDLLERIGEDSGLEYEFIPEKEYEEKYEASQQYVPIIIANVFKEKVHDGYRTSVPYLTTTSVLVGYSKDALKKEKIKVGILPWTEYAINDIKEDMNNSVIVRYETLNQAYADLSSRKIDSLAVNAFTVTKLMLRDSDLVMLTSYRHIMNYSFRFSDGASDKLISILNKGILSIPDAEKASLTLWNTAQKNKQPTLFKLGLTTLLIFSVVVYVAYVLYQYHRSRMKIKSMTYFDALTGARNFTKFMIDSERVITENSHKEYVLALFDIRDFSLYNSIYGKEKGDELLRKIVQTLELLGRQDEVFGRVNKDEFVLLLEFNEDNVRIRLEELLNTINKANEFKLRIACGCSRINASDYSLEQGYEKVLIAHKLSKQNNGMKDIYYFDEDDKAFYDYRNKVHIIESTMEQALIDGEFKIYMQPQYSTLNETIVGVEVLVRWIKAGEIRFYPNEFISIFEEDGFITQLDRYVFEEACKVLKYWKDHDIDPVNVSINFSSRNFSNEEFPEQLLEITERYGVNCSNITVEITESIAMSNDEISRKCQQRLHDYGFRIAIDDFGTGFSALSVLKDMRADVIKLDKTFFDDILKDDNAKSVVESIFLLIRKLNLTSVAEGIEVVEQVEFLRGTECDIIQGYYYARPMPVEQVNELLVKDRG